MNVPEIVIWSTADLLIERHGRQASLRAVNSAARMLKKGDVDGQITWLRILSAVRQMLSLKPNGRLH